MLAPVWIVVIVAVLLGAILLGLWAYQSQQATTPVTSVAAEPFPPPVLQFPAPPQSETECLTIDPWSLSLSDIQTCDALNPAMRSNPAWLQRVTATKQHWADLFPSFSSAGSPLRR